MTTAREETSRLADLLRREHHALAEFLVALATFDAERRWVELGYSSLFSFLVRELGLSKGAAYYRKIAAELVRRYPEVLEALRSGKLCLTSIVELAKVIAPENQTDVLPRFFHLSKREAKEVTAELLPCPAPPLRAVVTTPPPARVASALVSTLALEPQRGPVAILGAPEEVFRPTSSVPTERGPVGAPASTPTPTSRRAEVDPLTADLRRIHLTVSRRLLEKLAAARDALSHSHPGASDDEILEVALDLVVERHRKRRGIGAKPRERVSAVTATARTTSPGTPAGAAPEETSTCRPPSCPEPSVSEDARSPGQAAPPPPRRTGRSRHVPAAVWRAVWERDRGCCAWPLDRGGVCGATRKLQLDHVDGWALGAETTVEKCRLLCAWHNDVHARRMYGDDHMNAFTRPKEVATRGEPRVRLPNSDRQSGAGALSSRSSRACSRIDRGVLRPRAGVPSP